jgi:hypothetical protein
MRVARPRWGRCRCRRAGPRLLRPSAKSPRQRQAAQARWGPRHRSCRAGREPRSVLRCRKWPGAKAPAILRLPATFTVLPWCNARYTPVKPLRVIHANASAAGWSLCRKALCPLLAVQLPQRAPAPPCKCGRYLRFTFRVNFIQLVCILPLMLIVGFSGSAAPAVLPTGVQSRTRQAEAVTVEKVVLNTESDYSVTSAGQC